MSAFALHTTGAKALAYQPPLEPNDDTDWLADISFSDLLDMRDEASELGDWRGLEELDCELRARRADAIAALMARFVDAVEFCGELPWIEAGKLTTCRVSWYLHETLGTNEGTRTAVLMILDAAHRANAIAAMASDYARENVEELLRAGWAS